MHQLLIRCLKYGQDFNSANFLPRHLLSSIEKDSTARTARLRCKAALLALKHAATEISEDNAFYFSLTNVPKESDEESRKAFFDNLSNETVSSWAQVVVDNMYSKWQSIETDPKKLSRIPRRRKEQKMNVGAIANKMDDIERLAKKNV